MYILGDSGLKWMPTHHLATRGLSSSLSVFCSIPPQPSAFICVQLKFFILCVWNPHIRPSSAAFLTLASHKNHLVSKYQHLGSTLRFQLHWPSLRPRHLITFKDLQVVSMYNQSWNYCSHLWLQSTILLLHFFTPTMPVLPPHWVLSCINPLLGVYPFIPLLVSFFMPFVSLF